MMTANASLAIGSATQVFPMLMLSLHPTIAVSCCMTTINQATSTRGHSSRMESMSSCLKAKQCTDSKNSIKIASNFQSRHGFWSFKIKDRSSCWRAQRLRFDTTICGDKARESPLHKLSTAGRCYLPVWAAANYYRLLGALFLLLLTAVYIACSG